MKYARALAGCLWGTSQNHLVRRLLGSLNSTGVLWVPELQERKPSESDAWLTPTHKGAVTGEMTQQLTALTDLLDDLGSIPHSI